MNLLESTCLTRHHVGKVIMILMYLTLLIKTTYSVLQTRWDQNFGDVNVDQPAVIQCITVWKLESVSCCCPSWFLGSTLLLAQRVRVKMWEIVTHYLKTRTTYGTFYSLKLMPFVSSFYSHIALKCSHSCVWTSTVWWMLSRKSSWSVIQSFKSHHVCSTVFSTFIVHS